MANVYETTALEPEIRLRAGFDQSGIDDCWEWRRAKNDMGYGQIGVNGKVRYAHREMYSIFYSDNDLTTKDVILHECDNPSCVNPTHLSRGTYQDNHTDMHRKNRATRAKGREHPSVKLTEKQVQDIRRKIATEKHSLRSISREYGMSLSSIIAIRDGRSWAHLPCEWTPSEN